MQLTYGVYSKTYFWNELLLIIGLLVCLKPEQSVFYDRLRIL